jgi:hypothetical protein
MIERMYEGRRGRDGILHVWVVDEGERHPLDPRLDLADECPNGLQDRHQLAIALIANATGDDAKAQLHALDFKRRFVATLTRDWATSRETVLLVLAAIERDARRATRGRFNPNLRPGVKKG